MSECKAVLISVTCREGWDGVAEESKKTPKKAKTAESHFFTPPSLGNDFFIKNIGESYEKQSMYFSWRFFSLREVSFVPEAFKNQDFTVVFYLFCPLHV